MRTIACSLFLGALAVSGCWPPTMSQSIVPEPPQPLPAAVLPPLPPPPPPVKPEQVHTGNAREMAQALWDEVEREQTTGGRN